MDGIWSDVVMTDAEQVEEIRKRVAIYGDVDERFLLTHIDTLKACLGKAEEAILKAHTRGSMGHFLLCYQSLDAHVAGEES